MEGRAVAMTEEERGSALVHILLLLRRTGLVQSSEEEAQNQAGEAQERGQLCCTASPSTGFGQREKMG